MYSNVCLFFKQKTAYEVRISDWSSDVGSSDLARNSAMIARRADDDPIGTAQGIDQRSGLRRALFDIWCIHGHVERCAVEHNGFRALLRALVQHLPQYH